MPFRIFGFRVCGLGWWEGRQVAKGVYNEIVAGPSTQLVRGSRSQILP